jgi:hypothetical protein
VENKDDAVEAAMGKSSYILKKNSTKPEGSRCHLKLELLGLFCHFDFFHHRGKIKKLNITTNQGNEFGPQRYKHFQPELLHDLQKMQLLFH